MGSNNNQDKLKTMVYASIVMKNDPNNPAKCMEIGTAQDAVKMFNVDAATLNRLPDGYDVGAGKWERGKSCASFEFHKLLHGDPASFGFTEIGSPKLSYYPNFYGN